MTHCPHCKVKWETPSPEGCRVVCGVCRHLVYPPEFNVAPVAPDQLPGANITERKP